MRIAICDDDKHRLLEISQLIQEYIAASSRLPDYVLCDKNNGFCEFGAEDKEFT